MARLCLLAQRKTCSVRNYHFDGWKYWCVALTHAEESSNNPVNLVVNVVDAAADFPTSTEMSNVDSASNFTSLGVNLVAAFLIALKVW